MESTLLVLTRLKKLVFSFISSSLSLQRWQIPIHTSLELEKRILKTLDTIGNCQRPVFSLGVSQHMHKVTNVWKLELNWSSKLRDKDNNERKNTLVIRSCVRLWWLISGPQVLILRSRNQVRGKLLLSRKLRHFRGSRFSHSFILPTSPHYSLLSQVLW